MRLEEIVAQTPLAELPTDAPHCPDCGGTDKLADKGVESTLVGWMGGDWDPNHKWHYFDCGCGKSFIRETKTANVWYTRDRREGKVLLGMPSCFERYIYSCRACSGIVKRTYTNLDGSPLKGSMLVTTKDGPQYRTAYQCESCGHGGVVDSDYFRPPPAGPSTAPLTRAAQEETK